MRVIDDAPRAQKLPTLIRLGADPLKQLRGEARLISRIILEVTKALD